MGNGGPLAPNDRVQARRAHLIKIYHDRAGLSKAAVAKRAGISRNAFSDLLKGRTAAPNPATLTALKKALGIPDAEWEAAQAPPPERAPGAPGPCGEAEPIPTPVSGGAERPTALLSVPVGHLPREAQGAVLGLVATFEKRPDLAPWLSRRVFALLAEEPDVPDRPHEVRAYEVQEPQAPYLKDKE